MSKYNHLNLEEREKLYAWKLQGVSLREIGRRLKRNHTTLAVNLKETLNTVVNIFHVELITKQLSEELVRDIKLHLKIH